jgi:predicted dehydrogenase
MADSFRAAVVEAPPRDYGMRGAMHTLLFLDPGHFHAALTLRVPNPRVSDDIVVYAPDGAERRDFLAIVERFNARRGAPTCWRPIVVDGGDSLERLIAERRGDVVVLAGRNSGKARTMRRLHAAGFHVLADKPWLVDPADLDDVRASLAAPPIAMEMMTGRHDATARLMKRLVATEGVLGSSVAEGPAIELEGVHHLEKLVDGAPLRRPPWYFDVRVQGSGAVDIPTHLVDQAQWLASADDGAPLALLSARGWSTRVPAGAFRRITGAPAFPRELAPFADGDALAYFCNAELRFRVGNEVARVATRWDLAAPPGSGDTSRAVVRGTRATIVLEQGPETGGRRRLSVEPKGDAEPVLRALDEAVAAAQAELPGVRVERDAGRAVLVVPPALASGHEAHFALVLEQLLAAIDEHRWPAALAARTLAKYALLAEAAATVSLDGS